jgi:hypothetical protein
MTDVSELHRVLLKPASGNLAGFEKSTNSQAIGAKRLRIY